MKLPKHQLVKNNLKNEILSGKFENGDKFYSEAELTKRFHVSSITVIRALKELVAEGFLVRYQGKGTFISRSRKSKTVKFSDLEIFTPPDDRVEVISITRDNDPTVLTHLGLSSTDFYYAIERVRRAKQIPYIYQCTYLPERFVTHPQDLSYYDSIYTQMKNEFKIHLSTEPFVEYNQIILPTPQKIAALLEISEETPTVKQERTTTLSLSGQIIEYICSYKRWEYYKIKLESPTQ